MVPMPTQSSILLIEDSPGESELFRLALVQTHLDAALFIEHEAEAGLDFLSTRRDQAPLPSLILLDWHLHHTRGHEFLTRLRSDARLATIPVIVFTTSDDSADMTAAYGLGANGYVVKPGTFDELVRFINALCAYWLTWNRTRPRQEIAC
jgi:DNA-binding response OmpR family regulator